MSGTPVLIGSIPLPTNAKIDGRIDAQKGEPSGLARLGGDGRVPDAELPARLAEAALSATIGEVAMDRVAPVEADVRDRRGVRLAPGTVFLGDSNTQINSTEASRIYGQSMPSLVAARSRGRVLLARNSGVASDTMRMMQARLDADVIALRPGRCFILGMSNDTTKGVAHWQDARIAYEEIVVRLLDEGIQPILSTIPPRDNSRTAPDPSYGASGSHIYRLTLASNVFIRQLAARYRLPLVETHKVVTDPATGNWVSGYTNDGVHWNADGILAASQFIADQLAALYDLEAAPLEYDGFSVVNMVRDPLFIGPFTSGNGNRYPNGWSGPSSTTNLATLEAVAATQGDGVVGKWMRMVKVDGAGQVNVNHIRTLTDWATASGLPIAVGDRIGMGFRYAIDEVLASYVTVALIFRNSAGATIKTISPISQYTRTGTGTVWIEEIIPPGTHDIRFDIAFPAAASATVRIAQATLLDLTAIGVGSMMAAE